MKPVDSSIKKYTYQTAGCLARCSGAFVWPLLRKARRREERFESADFDDHAPNSARCRRASPHLAGYWRQEEALGRAGKASMVRAVRRAYSTDLLLACLLQLLSECVCEPLYYYYCVQLIDSIDRYPRAGDTSSATGVADQHGQRDANHLLLRNGLLFFLFASFGPMLAQPYAWCTHATTVRIRAALSELIYSKSLRIDKSSQRDYRQAISLISGDLNQLSTYIGQLSWIAIGPIECLVLTLFQMNSIGLMGSLVSLFVNVLVTFLRNSTNRLAARLSKKAAKSGDVRISQVNEALRSVRLLRMFAWTEAIARRIEEARDKELQNRRFNVLLVVLDSAFFFLGFPLCATTTLLYTHYIAQVELSQALISQVFLINRVHQRTLSRYIGQGLLAWTNAGVILDRIGDYMLKPQLEVRTTSIAVEAPPPDLSKERMQKSLSIRNASATWTSQSSPCFDQLNLDVCRPELLMITGKVGSGKSSLLQAVLGELPLSSGSIQLYNSKLSYANQECWVFSGTVRDNILFGEPMEAARYLEVLRVCSLLPDLQVFPKRDLTLVGERGVALSGGQKARINLARCLYQQVDAYLLDDPLSAVDAQVAQHIFHQALKGFLADKTIILVTHQIQFMRYADKLLILHPDAQPYEYGTPSELMSSINLTETGHPEVSPVEASPVDERDGQTLEKFHLIDMESAASAEAVQLSRIIDDFRRMKAWPAFKFYMRHSSSGWQFILLMFTTGLIRVFSLSINTWFNFWVGLQHEFQWSETGSFHAYVRNMSFEEVLSVAVLLWLGLFMVLFISRYHMYSIVMNGLHKLFRKLMHSILWAKLRFLDMTPQGQLINRISADVAYLDITHTGLLSEITMSGVSIMVIFFTIIISDPYMAVGTALVALVIYTSFVVSIELLNATKKVDGLRASAVFSHVSISLDGLSTIRASAKQGMFKEMFEKAQDNYSSVLFLKMSINRLMVASQDWTLMIFFASLISADVLQTMAGGGLYAFIGLNLSVLVSKMCQNAYAKFVELYTSIQAVSRIEEYCAMETEQSTLNTQSDEQPIMADFRKGRVEFFGVSLRYDDRGEIVLRDLSLSIEPGEKIGVVGRTGAGKSSLIAVLLHLYHFEGFIFIDGQDTKQLQLDSLRRSVSVIPQDPVLFSGTIRYNLDPLNEYSDEELWRALESVQLAKTLSLEQNKLSFQVCESGGNFSVGQRQLICLARAIVRRNKLLLLDEASANLDRDTDELIQSTIRREFADATVITVAHRLSTVVEADRIMVIDKGSLREFASPRELLQIPGGLFAAMVANSGSQGAMLTAKILDGPLRR